MGHVMPGQRIRVLMFAEAVTLAHVARPLSLARSIDPDHHEITLACDQRYANFAAGGPWRHVELTSLPSAQFMRALARGTPLYDLATLKSYVSQDLALIEAFHPDLVVGDFRLSLSVSARMAAVPYVAISNAYWSPAYPAGFALPVLPMTRVLPIPWAQAFFSAFQKPAFAAHCRPLNQLRLQHGLPSLGNNLRRIYTDADHLLIADAPALFPISPLPPDQTFIGPLIWSPQIPLPGWWPELSPDLPCVYVTLGSSGPPALLAVVLQALRGLPVQVIASAAGAPLPDQVPSNAHVASYLPGDLATARSSLVVCNGGSLTVQQALSVGTPVLGLASNMDQFMNMAAIEAAGAGRVLRTDRLSVASIREACQTLLQAPAYAAAARRLSPFLVPSQSVAEVFERVARQLIQGKPTPSPTGS